MKNCFERQEEIFLLIDKLNTETLKVVDLRPKNKYTGFLQANIKRNLHHLKSIYLLCKNNLSKDAAILFRSMYESYVDFAFILEDESDARLNEFLNFGLFQEIKAINNEIKFKDAETNKTLLNKDKINQLENKKKALEKEWDLVKHSFIKKNKKQEIRKDWSEKTKEEKAEIVDKKENYTLIYRCISNSFLHNSESSCAVYWNKENEKEITKFALLVAYYSFFYANKLLKVVNLRCKMHFQEKIEIIDFLLHRFNIEN